MSYGSPIISAKSHINELSVAEIHEVDGGLVPLALAAAGLATTAKFSFVIGVFAGIREKAGA